MTTDSTCTTGRRKEKKKEGTIDQQEVRPEKREREQRTQNSERQKIFFLHSDF